MHEDVVVVGEGAVGEPMDLGEQLVNSRKRARESGSFEIQPCVIRRRLVSPTLAVAAPQIVLVAKAHQAQPHRLAVTLGTVGAFDGTGNLTATNAGNITLHTAAVGGALVALPCNGIPGATLSAGLTLYIQGAQASAAVDDVTLTLTLVGGSADLGPPATDRLTSIELTLDICACRNHALNAPTALGAAAKINPGRYLHLQRASHCAGRALLIVGQAQPATYNGNLVLTPIGNRVEIFAQEVATGGQAAVVTPVVLANAGLGAGQTYWVQGAAASGALRDTGFQLELQALPGQEGDRVAVTVVDVHLDICQSRTGPGVNPTALNDADKLNPGRFLQLRNAGHHYGRAKLIVRQPVPAAFAGNLVLHALNNRVEAFQVEVPGGGQAAWATQGAPRTIAANTIPVGGLDAWADGANVSGGLRDTGFRLKLEDATDGEHVINNGDQVNLTVASFTQIQATISPTPPNTIRAGQPAPANHVFQSAHIDPDFAANPPLVLMRNAQPNIALVVTAAPAGLPIRWQAIRNPLDNAALGNAAAVPTVTPNGGNPEQATLSADNMGSFRIRAYIDCNGSNSYSDREPSIPLNLVLANATLVADNSAAFSAHLQTNIDPVAISLDHGTWPNNWLACQAPGGAGMTMELVADVTGGGADGRLGLNSVFGGLVNMQLADNSSHVYRDATVLPVVTYTVAMVYATNQAAATGLYSGDPLFRPADPPPVLLAFPLLDSGRPLVGVGGETATMGRSGVFDLTANRLVGTRYTLRCIDSPGDFFLLIHPDHPQARLHAIHYDLRFQANFCFWTNVSPGRGATGHPADRVYSVLRILAWQISGDWNVNWVGMNPGLVNTTPYAVAITAQNTLAPVARAQDHGVEVRPPSGIGNGLALSTT